MAGNVFDEPVAMKGPAAPAVGRSGEGDTMRRKASALASFAASVAVIGGICAFNAGPAAAVPPLEKFGTPEACQKRADQKNAEETKRRGDSTTPGHTYYCEPYEWVERKSWGLYVRENRWP